MKYLLLVVVLAVSTNAIIDINFDDWIQNGIDENAFPTQESLLGGRTLDELLQVSLKMVDNSAQFYANGGKFNASIEELVTIYCQNSSTTLTKVSVETISSVTVPSKGFVFVVHGWTDTYRVYFVDQLIDAYFINFGDMNICVVDYHPISQTELFTIAEPHSFPVAAYVSTFIRAISATYNVPFTKFTFIGHSLGGHISGLVGNYLNGELGAIYAADPCGLGCTGRYTAANDSLTAASAQYVQTIASNKYAFGPPTRFFLGHQVFYPNDGGPTQPGCVGSIICAHYRAIDYLILSFYRSHVFGARRCTSQLELMLGLCSLNPCDRLGPHANKSPTGRFYLITGPSSPYATNVACPSGILF